MLGTILVHCLAGKFAEVLPDITAIKGVKDAFGTLGRWDIVVKVEVSDLQAMDQLTIEIKSIKGVRDVETLMAKTIG
jgi:DNA-binding Lrp family transcriptional regulator